MHIDGWTATGAHTMVVGKPEVSGRAAEVLAATQTAFEAALRTIRPGKHIADVSCWFLLSFTPPIVLGGLPAGQTAAVLLWSHALLTAFDAV